MFRKTVSLFAASVAACCAFTANAAGFDGKTLVTNDWFDASFTGPGLTVDTVIATNTTTGITRGAGTWTSAPTNGTAKIVADADAGGGATKLAIDAADEELTFTPASPVSATGMETVSVEVNTVPVPTLTDPEGGAQTAFAIHSPDGVAHSLAAYVSDGTSAVWTNFVYASAADLTNAWFTLTLDFATVDNVRYVRYSIKPSAGSLTVLADSAGTQWFRSADATASTLSSVSFTGTGDVRSFSGDSLEETIVNVASYNGVSYETIAEAIAAAVADDWTNGNVTLLADATWKPSATGSYKINVDGHVLTVDGAIYEVSDKTYTISGFKYYWVGGTALGGDGTSWGDAGNWATDSALDTVATSAPASGDAAIFNVNGAAVALDSAVTIGTITASKAVTIYGTGAMTLKTEINGDGVVTFSDVTITSGASNATISAPVHVPEGKALTLHNAVGYYIYVTGKFTGKGGIIASSTGKANNYSGVILSGDGSEFEGTVKMYSYLSGNNHQQRDSHAIAPGSSSSNAVWRINVDSVAKNNSANEFNESGTYYLGTALVDFMNNNSAADINFEVGARNEDSCFASRNGGRFGSRNKLRWIAETATLTNAVSALQILEIAGGGTAVIASADVLPQRIKFTENGGVLKTSTAVASIDPSAVLTQSDASITFDDEGVDRAWTTAIASSNTGGFTKKGAGTLTLAVMPAYMGATTVSGGKLVIPAGTTLTDLVVENGAKIAIDMEEFYEGTTATITLAGTTAVTADDFTFANLRPQYSAAEPVIENGVVKIDVIANSDVLKWTGAAGDKSWSNPGNWAIGDTPSAILPDVNKTVVFPALPANSDNWDVELSSMQTVSNVIVAGDVKLSGAKIKVWNRSDVNAVSGDGLLVLGNNSGFTTDGTGMQSITIETPVRIDATSESPAQILGQWKNTSDAGLTLRILGDVTGSGALEVKAQRVSWAIENDWSAFTGSVYVYDDSAALGGSRRNAVTFKSTKATNANMVWTPNNYNSLFEVGSSTFYFKALNGFVTLAISQTNYQHNRLVVGNDDGVDSDLDGNFFANSYANLISTRGATLQKVGSSTLSFKGKRLAAYEIDDGVLELTANKSVQVPYKPSGNATAECEADDPDRSGTSKPTITMNGGTLKLGAAVTVDPSEQLVFIANKQVVFDDGGVDRIFATAIGSDTTASFTKKGSGTLTLSVVPTYSGDTYLDGGTLKIPTSAGVTVKTHVEGMTVRRDTTTEEGYTVYTLDKIRPLIFMVF